MSSNLFLVLSVLCLVSSSFGEENKYETKYDNINVEEILGNKRVLTNYIKCILDEGPCTPEGREFRKYVPDAIVTNCARCTDAQIKIIRKTAKFMVANRAADWEKIRNKYDPEDKYKEAFEKFLRGEINPE